MSDFEVNSFYELIIHDLVNCGYAVVDCFFTEAEINLLRANFFMKQDLQVFKKAAIGQASEEQIVEEVRGDFILWLNEQAPDEVEAMYFQKMNEFIAYVNRTCFLGIKEGEFHYASYPIGTGYQRHLDVFHKDTRRTLSVVLYLNEQDWTPANGGELVLFLPDEQGNEREEIVYALPGRLVIFDSKSIEHEVRTVNKPRYSITGWLKTR
ncbi:2OG-Fe(II) oxygenase [Myroides odoratus]|uniref:2OG-Fe(II) oxygenase n=1 Tax=Myroides odoratus TaxID=256 RepID=UPI003340C3A6